MKNRILIIILFFLSYITANAQWVYHFPNAFLMPAPGPEKYFLDNQNRRPGCEDLQLINVDVQLGTSFTSSFTGSPLMSSYIAPTLNFNISPRFNLSVGGIIMNNHTSMFNQFVPKGGMEQSILPGRLNSNFVLFASGDYLVSNNLLVYGSVYTSKFSVNNYSPFRLNSSIFGKNHYNQFSLGARYKLSNAFTIGARVEYSDGLNPYYNRFNNYGRSYFRNKNFYSPVFW
ncbi:MAG: hypothetical protein J7K53_08995 [Bacteroidales bacterium]|nr:hypothetical protein [Bacteroidales bacterium]